MDEDKVGISIGIDDDEDDDEDDDDDDEAKDDTGFSPIDTTEPPSSRAATTFVPTVPDQGEKGNGKQPISWVSSPGTYCSNHHIH